MSETAAGPESVFVVRLGATYPAQRVRVPEYCNARELEIALVVRTPAGEFETVNRMSYPRGEIDRGVVLLESIELPIVGFNLFNYGYRVLARQQRVAKLVPRTVDLYQLIWGSAARAWPSKRPRIRLTLDAVVAANTGGDGDGDRLGAIATLWQSMLINRTVVLGEQRVKLTPREIAMLRGERPMFKDVRAWARRLNETGSTTDIPTRRMRGGAALRHRIYGPIAG